MDFGTAEVQYLFHHIVLPMKLPQEDDWTPHFCDCLLHFTEQVILEYINHSGTVRKTSLLRAQSMLKRLTKVTVNGTLSHVALEEALGDLQPGDILPLHVLRQNAALITRPTSEGLQIDCFETSPQTGDVMSVSGALRWSFPYDSVVVPTTTASKSTFKRHFAKFLEDLSAESIAKMIPTTIKAQHRVPETRDTASPGMITHMLMAVLLAYGSRLTPKLAIVKRFRDDVLWNDALLPWRRNSLWLVIRVALQMSFRQHNSSTNLDSGYKNFMAFYLCRLCQCAVANKLPSEALAMIRTKIARRVLKLGSCASPLILQDCARTTRQALEVSMAEWECIQTAHHQNFAKSDVRLPAQQEHTNLILLHSRVYIEKALGTTSSEIVSTPFNPEVRTVALLPEVLPDPVIFRTTIEVTFVLADFESWVKHHLQQWTTSKACQPSSSICNQLGQLLLAYFRKASQLYDGFPEQLSIMMLTSLELWEALDKLTIAIHPHLEEYSPEIELPFLEPLILAKLNDMRRLNQIEVYLARRHKNRLRHNSSIFSDPKSSSFTVRHFKASPDLHCLQRQIEEQAGLERLRKRVEYETKRKRWNSLIETASQTSHNNVMNKKKRLVHDPSRCARCRIESQARLISIDVHEWPLPEDEVQLSAVLAELRLPEAFAIWRDATYEIQGLGRKKLEGEPNAHTTVLDYPALKSFAKFQGQLVTLGSVAKPFTLSHYRYRNFDCNVDELLPPCGLIYKTYHTKDKSWLAKRATLDMRVKFDRCLSLGPYQHLHQYTLSTSHTTNEVISNQISCPAELTIHEFVAFGSLRSGEEIQWMNILRELTQPNLTWQDIAVYGVVLQAATQVESRDDKHERRKAHQILEDEGFCRRLIEVLAVFVRRVQSNWNETNSIAIAIDIILRVLSLSTSQAAQVEALKLLREVRWITLEWVHNLAVRLFNIEGHEQITKAQYHIIYVACIVRRTFDIDESRVAEELESSKDIACYIQCAILIKDNSAYDIQSLPSYLSKSISRDRRMSHALESCLRTSILSDRSGLDLAIGQIWHGYSSNASAPWRSLPVPAQRWLVTKSQEGQPVQCDILEGQLLVNGKSLGRLPSSFVNHPTYKRLFNNRVLDVLVSDMPGMGYMTGKHISGYQVHFALREAELIIRTRKDQGVLELVPHHMLCGDIPKVFVTEHTHWLDIATGTIELRPLENTWQPSSGNWQINYRKHSGSYMQLGRWRLVDYKSSTFEVIASILSPIEYEDYLHVDFCADVGLRVTLPRYNLQFVVDANSQVLHSRELAASIDTNQNIGTLIGLESRLVLKADGSGVRSVIVPDGEVTYEKAESSHVTVVIKTREQRNVRYYQYFVDDTLQRLRGPPDLSQGYYIVYLHALTSNALPDPFTGLTGTEQALAFLRQACMLPTEPLTKAEMTILEKVSMLSPTREFYPPNLRKMQTVTWDSLLPPSSQHDEFVLLTRNLFSHSKRIEPFFKESTPVSKILNLPQDDFLLNRARARNAVHRSHEFGGDQLKSLEDREYVRRDVEFPHQVASRVHEVAYLLLQRPPKLKVSSSLWSEFESWGSVSGDKSKFTSVEELAEFHLPESWSRLYQFCVQHKCPDEPSELCFALGTIAFTSLNHISLTMIRTLVAFAIYPCFENVKPPPYSTYNLTNGCAPSAFQVQRSMKDVIEYPSHQYYDMDDDTREEIDKQLQELSNYFLEQWPCENPIPHSHPSTFSALSMENIMPPVKKLFRSCYQNSVLSNHVQNLQTALDEVNGTCSVPTVGGVDLPRVESSTHCLQTTSLLDLLKCEPPGLPPYHPAILIAPRQEAQVSFRSSRENERLASLLENLKHSEDWTHRTYGEDLGESHFEHLKGVEMVTPDQFPWCWEAVVSNVSAWKSYVDEAYEAIVDGLETFLGTVGNISKNAGLCPRLNPLTLLALLGGAAFHRLSAAWQQVLIGYGGSVTQLQRARRLQMHMWQGNLLAFFKESEHGGRDGWSSSEFPSWLVLEADNDIMIRPVQARVALKMISSTNRKNSVLQLNMGDGKSSVITPMMILLLSDGTRLARLIVLDSLTKSTKYLLRQTVGRLLGRPIYFTPFSRRTKLHVDVVADIVALQKKCLHERGLLLTQPEHLLSFRLIGLERLWAGDIELANSIFKANSWSESSCWNVIDECDAILVDNQLIYTVGPQQVVHGGNERWQTIQHILGLTMAHIQDCQNKYPEYVELIDNGPGRFPELRLSDPQAGRFLAIAIAEDLRGDGLLNTNFPTLAPEVQQAILSFAKDLNIPPEVSEVVQKHFAGRVTLMEKLLVIRGFLAHEILYFLFESKRWRVNYGLDPRRCQMVVPYIAKDVPSPRAEFGHPDIALGLTCLSYYSEGLSSAQLLRCFQRLRTASDPGVIYQEWVAASTLPQALRDERNVNLEDGEQWKDLLFPGLRYQKPVVDYFLNYYVFPKEAKEFPKKLPVSGWDIPSTSDTSKTVGFSGTNDANRLLPCSIGPENLPELASTGARVLTYALQPDNHYLCAKDTLGYRMSVPKLLGLIQMQKPQVTVLLDAGAQVLELRNREVVETWLALCTDIDTAIYFDETLEELTVLKRDGTTERLVSSVYNTRIDRCIVYLDQVRTRGTDLKFAPGTRAAVTICQRLGKDTAMQAFLRLRDFGHTHSILVLAPPEVDREIWALRSHSLKEAEATPLGMIDVLRWLFEQTVRNNKISLPSWVEQGLSYTRRHTASQEFGLHRGDLDLKIVAPADTTKLLSAWEEDEARSLQDLYSPSRESHTFDTSDAILARDSMYQEIRKVGKGLSLQSKEATSRHQMYQREVELEVEIVRTVERPPKVDPRVPVLQPDILNFVRTGYLPTSSYITTFEAFEIDGHCSFQNLSRDVLTPWVGQVRVTEDFAVTISPHNFPKGPPVLDQYANSVNWILTTTSKFRHPTWLVLSPFEANALIKEVRASKHVCLHIYAPSIRKSRGHIADDLRLFNISGSDHDYTLQINQELRRELGFFAGRLYLDDYGDYLAMLDHISNGYPAVSQIPSASPLYDRIRMMVRVRRRGEDTSKAHMGRILDGRRLGEADFM
ncbi:hypothetical protein MMC13_000535 [Lambiella insularis]|nr:hypothetical protein [Lambiella insularis]